MNQSSSLFNGQVYCVTVPSGFFLVRHNQTIGVTGNSHNPSTLRLACPYFHNLPRPGDEDSLDAIIRNMIVARPGHVFVAADFSGIEALLVGYEARSPRYMRLCYLDVHSFYTAYCLNQFDGRVSSADLPELSWDDDKLRTHLAGIKKEFRNERNKIYKHLIHAKAFGQTPPGAQEKILRETKVEVPLKLISTAMAIYDDLFPEIPKWQLAVQLQADRDGYLRNAFDYVHRFNRVFHWKKECGQWQRSPGEDAEKVLAFRPQSNAAAIIKEVMLRLYFERLEEAGQYLRLQVHDELVLEPPVDKAEAVTAVHSDVCACRGEPVGTVDELYV